MLKQDYDNEFFELVGQQKINFSFFELYFPDDNPAYTLKNVMEKLDFSDLLACYSDKGRSGHNPIMMYACFDVGVLKIGINRQPPYHIHICSSISNYLQKFQNN
ncbi:MAG: hypothetical protein Q4F28_09545 [Eubacteriales bacterium]|nr:hypothetical protein [Eubacteriales bacterium]